MTVNILIVDDEEPARQRLRDVLGDLQFPCEVDEAGNAQQALDLLRQHAYDSVLLDVQMPENGGLKVAQEIAEWPAENRPEIVFVTAHEDYAVRAFEFAACDYLLKPVRASRLAQTMQRIQFRHAPGSNSPEGRLKVFSGRSTRWLSFQEVLFFRAEDKYVSVHTGNDIWWMEISLVSLERRCGDRFVRLHRDTLANRDALCGIEKNWTERSWSDSANTAGERWYVTLNGTSERLPISRRELSKVRRLFDR